MVIKPGKEFIVSFVLIVAANIVMFVVTIDEPQFCLVSSCILLLISVRGLVLIGRTLIFDYKGCTVCFGKYKKIYTWNDLILIRYEDYRNSFGQKISDDMTGIIFSTKLVHKPSWILPAEYSMFTSPFSFFYVYFYNQKDFEKVKKAGPYFTYIAEEQMFLRMLLQWNVPVENIENRRHHT